MYIKAYDVFQESTPELLQKNVSVLQSLVKNTTEQSNLRKLAIKNNKKGQIQIQNVKNRIKKNQTQLGSCYYEPHRFNVLLKSNKAKQIKTRNRRKQKISDNAKQQFMKVLGNNTQKYYANHGKQCQRRLIKSLGVTGRPFSRQKIISRNTNFQLQPQNKPINKESTAVLDLSKIAKRLYNFKLSQTAERQIYTQPLFFDKRDSNKFANFDQQRNNFRVNLYRRRSLSSAKQRGAQNLNRSDAYQFGNLKQSPRILLPMPEKINAWIVKQNQQDQEIVF